MLSSGYTKDKIEAGCDEAGRGCLAGPVFAAAVILPRRYKNVRLNDSKKLNEKDRTELRTVIEKEALAWAVAKADPEEIDELNILKASYLAMHRAIEKLYIRPELLLIDGNRFEPYADLPHICLVKGDGKYLSIAAASILAKTYRDEYMDNLHNHYPGYHWDTNKGYPTLQHKLAIMELGLTPYHRKSFNSNIQLRFGF
jgi:ribonuclease HII